MIQYRHEVPMLDFYRSVSLILFKYSKQPKNVQMTTKKSQKTFSQQTLIQDQVIRYFSFYFLKSNINQFNSVSSNFPQY